MSRVELMQEVVTVTTENRLLREIVQAQNVPRRLRDREKMGEAKTGAEAREEIRLKKAKTQALKRGKGRKNLERGREEKEKIKRKYGRKGEKSRQKNGKDCGRRK